MYASLVQACCYCIVCVFSLQCPPTVIIRCGKCIIFLLLYNDIVLLQNEIIMHNMVNENG